MTPEEIEEKSQRWSEKTMAFLPLFLLGILLFWVFSMLNFDWQKLLRHVATIIGTGVALFYVPYLLRRGWEQGKQHANKHAKVCDLCYREISGFNEWLKKNHVLQQMPEDNITDHLKK